MSSLELSDYKEDSKDSLSDKVYKSIEEDNIDNLSDKKLIK